MTDIDKTEIKIWESIAKYLDSVDLDFGFYTRPSVFEDIDKEYIFDIIYKRCNRKVIYYFVDNGVKMAFYKDDNFFSSILLNKKNKDLDKKITNNLKKLL
jgi:hypothetical protein